MSRCLDDHPGVICFCESEINRTLFPDYSVSLHFRRMNTHGLSAEETAKYLDRKRQNHIPSMIAWYREVTPRLSSLYVKQTLFAVGDKSPDFFRSPALVHHLIQNYKLIYTVRDPRAILASIEAQTSQTREEKESRWEALANNYKTWHKYLDNINILIIRYEDLVRSPEKAMQQVYDHVGVLYSPRFMRDFARPFPGRFLWKTAVNCETGLAQGFDPSRIDGWRESLSCEMHEKVRTNPAVLDFMTRFGYAI
jgi:hypothetical protein